MSVRLLNELSEFEKLALIDMSYSRLDVFHGKKYGCQIKYFKQYIEKVPRTFSAPAAMGNIGHAVLENNLQPDTVVNEDLLQVLLDDFEVERPKWDPDNQISESLLQAGRTALVEFIDRHKGESFPILAKEMEFAIVIGTALFRGYIDRVDVSSTGVYLYDYKFGRQEVAKRDIPENLQLGLYAIAMRKMFPNLPIHGSLYYLRSGRIKGHHFSDDDLLSIESRLNKLVGEIIETRFFSPTPNESVCNYCDFAQNATCQTGVARLRRRRG